MQIRETPLSATQAGHMVGHMTFDLVIAASEIENERWLLWPTTKAGRSMHSIQGPFVSQYIDRQPV